MPMENRKLGEVLLHIYDFSFGGAIYLENPGPYRPDTPCMVVWDDFGEQYLSLHQACLDQGFKNWLNVAVISDTYDEVSEKTEENLVAAFNEACREGGWLWKMMNYLNTN